jgi:hypothetical protein
VTPTEAGRRGRPPWQVDLGGLTVAGEAALRATAGSQRQSVAGLVGFSMRWGLGPERARAIWEPIDPA